MREELKPGDRVRVRWSVRGFRCGDVGIVRSGPQSFDGGMPYYLVTMGEDGRGTAAAFGADEIEPDGGTVSAPPDE